MEINDKQISKWLEECPEHDHELLHSDDDGIVVVIRFNNQKEKDDT